MPRVDLQKYSKAATPMHTLMRLVKYFSHCRVLITAAVASILVYSGATIAASFMMKPLVGEATIQPRSIARKSPPIAASPTLNPAVPTFRSQVRPLRSMRETATSVTSRFVVLSARSPTLPSEPESPAFWKSDTAYATIELMPIVLLKVSTSTASRNGMTYLRWNKL